MTIDAGLRARSRTVGRAERVGPGPRKTRSLSRTLAPRQTHPSARLLRDTDVADRRVGGHLPDVGWHFAGVGQHTDRPKRRGFSAERVPVHGAVGGCSSDDSPWIGAVANRVGQDLGRRSGNRHPPPVSLLEFGRVLGPHEADRGVFILLAGIDLAVERIHLHRLIVGRSGDLAPMRVLGNRPLPGQPAGLLVTGRNQPPDADIVGSGAEAARIGIVFLVPDEVAPPPPSRRAGRRASCQAP